jgi:3-keto-L-gulonate-6-phosphate decarboxylase
MANEHTLVFETEQAIPVTCADGAGIEQGTLVTIADPFTCAAAASGSFVFGVTKTEKIANDGKVKVAVYHRGIFKATLGGTVTAGQALAASGSNIVQVAVAGSVASKTIGIALETGTNGETILYELNPGCNNTVYS